MKPETRYQANFKIHIAGDPILLFEVIEPENKLIENNIIQSNKTSSGIVVNFKGNVKINTLRNTIDDIIKTAILSLNVQKELKNATMRKSFE
jgi:hypothetical protein